MSFSQWLRANSERHLLEAAQADMARRYLNRPGPVQEAGLGPFFWRRVFVPVYRRLPWELRRSVIQALPGSHRRRWQAQRPARRQPNVQQPIRTTSKGADSMPKTVDTPRAEEGAYLYNAEEKVFEDIKANPGEKAFVFLHTVPYEGSVGLVNLLTATRLLRKGFEVHVVLYGPGVLMASATRGYPSVGKEGFPGNLAINNQIKTLLKEGAHVYACRFAMGALYGFREDDLIDGVKAFNPLDVLDSALAAWRAGAFQLNTWTV